MPSSGISFPSSITENVSFCLVELTPRCGTIGVRSDRSESAKSTIKQSAFIPAARIRLSTALSRFSIRCGSLWFNVKTRPSMIGLPTFLHLPPSSFLVMSSAEHIHQVLRPALVLCATDIIGFMLNALTCGFFNISFVRGTSNRKSLPSDSCLAAIISATPSQGVTASRIFFSFCFAEFSRYGLALVH